MHSTAVAVSALLAASQVLAAPAVVRNDARSLSAIEGVVHDIFGRDASVPEARSLNAIGNLIGDFAEKVLGPTSAKRDASAEARSLSAIEGVISDIFNKRGEELDARSLTAIGNFISGIFNKRGEELDARSLSAIENFIGGIFNKRDESLDARSLKAVGAAVAGGIASGAAGAIASDVLGSRAVPSGLVVDTETGTIYMDVPDANEGRSLKAVGTAIAGGIASGVAGAVASDVLGKRASGLMVDTETGTLYMDVPDANEERSLKAIGTALVGGAASLATGAILNNKRGESGLMIDTETGTLYMDVPDAVEGRSLKAVGAAVAGGIASGVAGAVASDVLGSRAVPSGIMVDTETGTIYMDVSDSNEGRSLKAVGAAVAGGIASGAAGAIASDVLGSRAVPSGLMVDTETGTLYMDVPDAVEGRSLKAVGAAVAGGIASGAAGAIASDVLGSRSLSAIEGVISDIFNKRAIDELD